MAAAAHLDEVLGGGHGALVEQCGLGFEDEAAMWNSTYAMGNVEAHPMLPYWDETSEQPDHRGVLLGFCTKPCADLAGYCHPLARGYCSMHWPEGKAICFAYHYDSEHRRRPIDPVTGHLLYWDMPCPLGFQERSCCPEGEACLLSHSREELMYHPGKYKTRRCNGVGCRGEATCCFAHTDAELRVWAPDRYSYVCLAVKPQAALGSLGAFGTAAAAAAASSEEWRRPHFQRANQPPPTRHKQRFCASLPDVSQCRRGAACAFAHSREEARTPLLTEEQEQQVTSALTEEFFMFKFKTLWCPIGVQHDWQSCVYAHNYQDARRKVSIGYGPRPCPYWAKKEPNAEYAQRCPLGLRCPYSHGAKEQLYHPQYFRTVICRDVRAKACPRKSLCAFFHKRPERRKVPQDNMDYSVPLKEDEMPQDWITDFLIPPFRDAAGDAKGMQNEDQQLGLDDTDDSAQQVAHVQAEVDAYWATQANEPHSLFMQSAANAYAIMEQEMAANATQQMMAALHQGYRGAPGFHHLSFEQDDEDADDKACTPRTRTDSSGSTMEPGQRAPGKGLASGSKRSLGVEGTPCKIIPSSNITGEGPLSISSQFAEHSADKAYNPFQGYGFPGFLASQAASREFGSRPAGKKGALPWDKRGPQMVS